MSSTDTIDRNTLESVVDVELFDGTGKRVKFRSLFEDNKTIVVFIRHFFCGLCMQYVQSLATVREEALKDAGTSIAIIGCGSWEPIQGYKAETGFAGNIYAHPERIIHKTLGMVSALTLTPSGQDKASYIKLGFWGGLGYSFKWIFTKNVSMIGKQGNVVQNGGEFVLGPGPVCHFAHRMQHTEDHADVAAVMGAAGVQYP